MKEILIDGESLTFEQVIEVAYGNPSEPRIVLTDDAQQGPKKENDDAH